MAFGPQHVLFSGNLETHTYEVPEAKQKSRIAASKHTRGSDADFETALSLRDEKILLTIPL